MEIVNKMIKKQNNIFHEEGVTIAFLGDSVTQGCFEIFTTNTGNIETIFDKLNSYEMSLYKNLALLYPTVPVHIINAGISGDNSCHGANRVERDIIRHMPDLTVVCYGLNDCSRAEGSIEKYVGALKEIFDKLKANGIEIIFMTPNMMNTSVSPHLKEWRDLAECTAELQNDGTMDKHIEAARKLCEEENIPVCDCYKLWKLLEKSGVDTTELLSNKINHPVKEMYKMFGYELVKTMLTN